MNRREFMRVMGMSGLVVAFPSLITRAFAGTSKTPTFSPPGSYTSSWIGNSFSGNIPAGNTFPAGAASSSYYGFGKWVQDKINAMTVTPDGTVLTASSWDEGGRMTGLYRENDVHSYALITGGPVATSTDSWGTMGTSVAVIGDLIFISNIVGYVLQFKWSDPRDLQSTITYQGYVRPVTVPPQSTEVLSVMAGCAETLAVAFEGHGVQIFNPRDMSLRKNLSLSNITGIAIDSKNTLWVIQNGDILHYDMDGKNLPGHITGVAKPTAISINENDVMLICDDGPNQQVLSYALSANPRLIQRYGLQGGLGAGTPGEMAPNKFFGLRGANMDSEGNLYVGMCFGPNGSSPVVIRSLNPQQELNWEVSKYCFVTVCCFDPTSDGTVIYGPEFILSYDPDAAPGQGWKAEAITLDHFKYPNDPRYVQHNHNACSTELRYLQGKRLLYTMGQTGGGYDLYTFEPSPSQVAYYVGSVTGPGFAWSVDANGDIWRGQGNNHNIRKYTFTGWSDEGNPTFAVPVEWPVPSLFTKPTGGTNLNRAHYESNTDTLYLGGYTAQDARKTWGEVGATLARFDNWIHGSQQLRWAVTLPVDQHGYPPKSFSVAGDYIFTVHIYPVNGKDTVVTILSIEDGATVGTIIPGETVGWVGGWVDTIHGIEAMRRKNGQYLIIVEGDNRGKNIVYQWTPS